MFEIDVPTDGPPVQVPESEVDSDLDADTVYSDCCHNEQDVQADIGVGERANLAHSSYEPWRCPSRAHTDRIRPDRSSHMDTAG